MGPETTTTLQNPWAPFFGELSPDLQQHMDFTGDRRGGISADQRFRHETYNLPEAYKGKSRHLEDVLDFMIRKEDEFYTSQLMPWEYTDDIHVQWDVFKFNRTIADIEPEQGIPRLVTAQTEGQSASLLRRGLAFQLEHGFFTTERGKKHFMLNLQQITDAIHTTAYFGVMHALLTGKEFYKEWRKRYGNVPKRRGNVYLRERQTWALLQKDIKGLYIMDARAKHDMGLQNVRPNVIVMPSKASMYAQMVPTTETDYARRGPGAHEALASGKMETTFRGSKVFEAESFDVDFSDQNVDLLSRTKMIGEYFQVTSNEVIQIFDADEDAFVKISYDEALRHALNRNDKRFEKSLLSKIKHDHFLRADRTNGDDAILVNQIRNHAKWKPNLEKAFQDTLKPRISPARIQSMAVGDPDEPRMLRVLRTFNRIASGMAATDVGDLLATYMVMNYLGHDNVAPGMGPNRPGVLTVTGGATQIGSFPTLAPDIISVAEQRRLTLALTGALNYYAAGPAVAAAAAAPAVADAATFVDTFAGAAHQIQNVAWDVIGFQANVAGGGAGAANVNYRTLYNRLVTEANNSLNALNGTAGAGPITRTDAVNLANTVNDLHKLEDAFALFHDIVARVNYKANHKILLFRPFATWRMGSAIIAQGGNELGSTFHGHHDFQLSDDVVRKTILGHYTFYSKAVVKRPKHYCIEEDVHCQGYVSGGGTQFFDADTLDTAITEQTIGTDQNRHDLIAWVVDDGKAYSKPLHMSGRLPEHLADFDDGKDHFNGCAAMRHILNGIGALDAGHDDSYMGGNNNLNFMCFHGAQRDENGIVTHLNKGHWGELTYDGCMGIRTGQMVEKNASSVLKIGGP